MKQEKRVLLYQNKDYEAKTRASFENAKTNIELAITTYSIIVKEDLQPSEWNLFLTDVNKLVKEKICKNAKVPTGMNAEKFYELLEMPDTSQLLYLLDVKLDDQYSTNIISSAFFSYNGKDVEYTQTTIDVIQRHNVYVTEEEYKVYCKLEKFVKLANSLKNDVDFRNIIELRYNPIIFNQNGEYKINTNKFNWWCKLK